MHLPQSLYVLFCIASRFVRDTFSGLTARLLRDARKNQAAGYKRGTMKLGERISRSYWSDVRPVWVLSTGRCGSATLSNLLKLSPLVTSYHEPIPKLFAFSYDYYMGNASYESALNTIGYLRDEMVHEAFYRNSVYTECNNRLSYVADLLHRRYPKSKFIFMHRNPIAFIVSGMRRGYYEGHSCDFARIRPKTGDPAYPRWGSYSTAEKIAWNWVAVNSLILDFISNVPAERHLHLKAEDLFSVDMKVVHNLFAFIQGVGYAPPTFLIRRLLERKHNAQQANLDIDLSAVPQRTRENVYNMVYKLGLHLGYDASVPIGIPD